MNKRLLPFALLIPFLLAGCSSMRTPSKSEEVSSQPVSSEVAPSEEPSKELSEEPSETHSEEPSEQPSEELSEEPSEEPSEESSEQLSEEESEEPSEESSEESSELDLTGVSLKVDYQNIGGANIPNSWEDSDTASKVREAEFEIADGVYFGLDFVGKWKISNKHGELQTKKNPASYIRSNCEIVVKSVVIEVYQADVEVYLTNDHTGAKVSETEVDAVHGDGQAYSYEINSAEWSFFAAETYSGTEGTINFYSFTFYF